MKSDVISEHNSNSELDDTEGSNSDEISKHLPGTDEKTSNVKNYYDRNRFNWSAEPFV